MGKYILSIDQSTSGTKVIIFNSKGKLIDRVTIEHKQYYPRPGWVEHDPEEIYNNTLKAIKQILGRGSIEEKEVAVFAITNQRETVVVWDKNTGKPVWRAAVWQCQRGKEICKDLRDKGYEKMVKDKTGLIVDPYFSASKIKWILDNVAGANQKAKAGQLLFGTIDSWLIWNLTAGKVHATDPANACRTMLYNIYEMKWDEELFDILDIPLKMAPEIICSDKIFGYTAKKEGFKEEIPISGVMGDSHAALFGQGCFSPGMAKTTYGTGSSIMMNTGKKPVNSDKGLVTSIGWGFEESIQYVLEGNVHYTGATIKWLIDNLGLVSDVKEVESLAAEIEDNGGVYFVPAFSGLGAPYWDNEATGTISGLTAGTDKARIVRAALEAIAYQIKDVLDLMVTEAGVDLKKLRVDGGPTNNKFLMQFQADMLDIAVEKNVIEEVSALGSAYAAGLATGIWHDFNEIAGLRKMAAVYHGEMESARRYKLYEGWKQAVCKARL